MADQQLFYHFDTVRGPWSVTGHAEHRLAQARLLQRTRYSIVYRINDEEGRTDRTGGEESLTNRYFEALSAGTIMLGTAPASVEWDDCFGVAGRGRPDPGPGARDRRGRSASSTATPTASSGRGRQRSTTFLRRHDWAHRWRDVLALVGLEPHPRLTARLDRLSTTAWPAGRRACRRQPVRA